MELTQSKIEEVLKFHLLINSNTDLFYNCYYKCANKKNMMDLYNKKITKYYLAEEEQARQPFCEH